MKLRRAGLTEAMLARMIITESGCIEWLGPASKKGYSVVNYRGVSMGTHRAMYLEFIGEYPKELELDHLCRNARCVNPTHLEPVTRRVNLHRGNGFIGINARKTHCPRDHPLPVERNPQGKRVCKECVKETNRRYREKQKRKAN